VAEVAVDADSSSPVVETNWLPGTDDTEVALMESLPDITVLKPPEPPLSVIGFLTRDEERCLKYQINIVITTIAITITTTTIITTIIIIIITLYYIILIIHF